MKIIFILLSLLWIYSQALIDKKHFDRKQFFEDHSDRFLSRVMVGFLVALFSIPFSITLALLFFGLFDLILNLMRGLPHDHLGNNAIDKFFSKRKWLWYVSKIIAIVLALWI